MAQTLKSTMVNGTDWSSKSAQGVTSKGTVAVFKGTEGYNAEASYVISGLPNSGSGKLTLNWAEFPKEIGIVIDYSACYLKDLDNPKTFYPIGFNGTELPDLSRFVNAKGVLEMSLTLTYCRSLGELTNIEFEEG